jgi:hypothetical protein
MPRQNRVTPFGEIVAVPERGSMMGIRGILHDDSAEHDPNARIRRRWAGRAWICCLLEFRGRRGRIMAPHHYTQLFFLDEPTALAAGHRPCAFCRRADYNRFRAAWASGNVSLGLGPRPLAPEMDRVLHAERLGPDRAKRTHAAASDSLPDGTFVVLSQEGLAIDIEPYLLWQGTLWRWTHAGYAEQRAIPEGLVSVLTPPSTVAALRAGYQPFPPASLAAPPATSSPRPPAGPG